MWRQKHALWAASVVIILIVLLFFFSGRRLGVPNVEYIGITEQELFADNTGIIEVETKLKPGQQGTLVAKNDYELGKRFRLGVNAEGTVYLEISDSNQDLVLETTTVITDDARHTIVAGMDTQRAWLTIDGTEEAAEEIHGLMSIWSSAELTGGEDAAYEDWTGE